MATLCLAAVSIGFIHTLLGPDHYVPFVAMAKAGKWSLQRTLTITAICGIGHVASSALLGLLGVSMGIGISKIEGVESTRGLIAAWMLLAFGLVYLAWGLKRAVRNQTHDHLHLHADGTFHSHAHSHQQDHIHIHGGKNERNADSKSAKGAKLTPWVLFTVFIFGPCEPLIPLLMYPAAKGSIVTVFLITGVFGVITTTTMISMVALIYSGFRPIALTQANRYAHALAGLAIAICAVAILVLDI